MLSYLAFILATGLYLVLGQVAYYTETHGARAKAYVGESEGSSLYASFVLVIGPAIAFALIYHLLGGLFGGLNTLLVGTAACFLPLVERTSRPLSALFISCVSR